MLDSHGHIRAFTIWGGVPAFDVCQTLATVWAAMPVCPARGVLDLIAGLCVPQRAVAWAVQYWQCPVQCSGRSAAILAAHAGRKDSKPMILLFLNG